jgi:hypothetical protein
VASTRARSRSICSGVAPIEDAHGEGERHLAFRGEDVGRPGAAQPGHVAEVVRPDHDVDAGIDLPGLADDLLVLRARARGHHERRRPGDARLAEHLRPARVAVDGPHVERAQAADGVEIELDHRRLDPVVQQQGRHGAAHGPVAHDDGAVHRSGLGGRGLGPGIVAATQREPGEGPLERPRQPQEEGSRRDRGDRRGHQRRRQVGGERPEPPAQLREDEGELADRGQRRRHRHRGAGGSAPHEHDRRRRNRLGQEHDGQRGRRQPRAADHRERIEEHAHRHEEEHGEGVAHRQRVGRRPQAQVAPPHDGARQEGPQRHRHAEEPRRPHRDAQRHDEDGEREQLARPRGGHAVEEPGDHAAPDDDDQRRQPDDLRGRRGDGPGDLPRPAPAAEHRRQDHEGRDGEDVLDDDPADGEMAGAGVQ